MRWGRIEGLSQRITVVHWEKRPPPPGPGLLLNLVFNLEPVCRSGGRRAQARPGRGLWAGASQGLCLLTSRCLMGPRGRKWGVQDAARRAAAFFQGGEGSGEGCCIRPFQLSWRRRLLQGRVTLGLRSGKGLGRCRGQAPWVGGAWVGTSTKVASLGAGGEGGWQELGGQCIEGGQGDA